MSSISLEERLHRLELLYRVGISLASEHNREALVETILEEARNLCHADGGTLYLRSDDDSELQFAIVQNRSLKLNWGITNDQPVNFNPIPLFDACGEENHENVASHALWCRKTVNIPNAYDTVDFDFSGTKRFDAATGYHSRSFLTIPLIGASGQVIGVLQLINASDLKTGEVVPFSPEDQAIVEALAAQAGVSLDNQQLLASQRRLIESIIHLIAAAIDAKSPYTGGHCERVPLLTEMLAQAACDATEGPFSDFGLEEDEWYELRIAAWLHDCGKVVTPVHVMDKATKLEAIHDRIEEVKVRFELLKRDAEIEWLRAGNDAETRPALMARLSQLDDELVFLEKSNVGSEFLSPDDRQRIAEIGRRTIRIGCEERPLLSEDEIANLGISRGTLREEERRIINAHIVQTIVMLEALPFPRNLRRVPEYAGGHHEKIDGGGYPRGIYAGDMSVPARIIAIADIFEALTAQDRPYKKGKALSEAMAIMGFMKRDNHLDPELFDLFVRSGVYRKYGELSLPPKLVDEVDEASLLAIKPRPFKLPDEATRKQRLSRMLPEYEAMR